LKRAAFGDTMSGMDEFEIQAVEAIEGVEGVEPEEEIVDGLPVLADVREVQAVPAGGLGAVHAAAVAATGFVAGAATLALARRLGARRLAGAGRELVRRQDPFARPWAAGETRTFIVRVRVINREP
jgi:hypothetical protein